MRAQDVFMSQSSGDERGGAAAGSGSRRRGTPADAGRVCVAMDAMLIVAKKPVWR